MAHPRACSVSDVKDTTKFWQREARKQLRRIARLDRIEELEVSLVEMRRDEAALTDFLNHYYRNARPEVGMKWIALKDKSTDALQTLRLFDNDGKAVAFVEPVEGDFVYQAYVEGDFGPVTRQRLLGQFRDIIAAVRAVHRVFKLPDLKDPQEIAGEFEPVEQP